MYDVKAQIEVDESKDTIYVHDTTSGCTRIRIIGLEEIPVESGRNVGKLQSAAF